MFEDPGRKHVRRLALVIALGATIPLLFVVPAGAGGVFPPIVNNDTFSTLNGFELDMPAPGFFSNDRLPSGNIFATIVSGPSQGSLDPPASDPNPNGAFEYTPDVGFVGTDSFTYCIVVPDFQPGCSSGNAKVSIVVMPGVAVDDGYFALSALPLRVPSPGILANDIYAPGQTPAIVQRPRNGGVFFSEPGGDFTYSSSTGFVGTDTFTYCIEEPTGGPCLSNTAIVTINVEPLPVAVDETYNFSPPAPLDLSAPGVLTNDLNVPANGIAILTGNPSYGVLDLDPDGSFSYSSNIAIDDSFTYCIAETLVSICLSNSATVSLVPNLSTTADDTYSVGADEPLTVSAPGVLANDGVSTGSGGPVVRTRPSHGSVTLRSDGSTTYVPDAGFVGTDSFTYCIAPSPASPCTSNVATERITVAVAMRGAGRLAATGSNHSTAAALGLTAVLLGVALVFGSRRRSST